MSVLTSCSRKSLTSSTTTTVTTDTTTRIHARDVRLQVPGDSVQSALDLKTFADSLAHAEPGQVIRQGTSASGRTKYVIRKSSAKGQPLAFQVEAHSAGKDTTVTVRDTTKVIRVNRETIVVQPPPASRSAFFYLTHPRQFVLDHTRACWLVLALLIVLLLYRLSRRS